MKMRLILVTVLAFVVILAGCQTMSDDQMGDDMMEGDAMEGESMEDESMTDMSMATAEITVTIEVLGASPTPLAPVAWAVHEGPNPFVETGMGKLGGLEALAEDGDPSNIGAALEGNDRVVSHGVAAIPDGASSAGPATPGTSYSFAVTAEEGLHLSFATMYVQSNDLFYSPGPDGLALFDMSAPVEGDVTSMIVLYDAGTEVNEQPGRGPNQAPRQSGPDTGRSENAAVRPVTETNDGYSYPDVSSVILVTIHEGGMMSGGSM